MELDVRALLEIAAIVLILKMIVSRWQPPVQESLQALIAITLGIVVGFCLYPTKDGFVTAVVSSGFAFYGSDLFREFKSVKDDFRNELLKDDEKENTKKKQ